MLRKGWCVYALLEEGGGRAGHVFFVPAGPQVAAAELLLMVM